MTQIGNKAPGGGSEVSATPTSITIDGVTTTLSTDLSEGGTKFKRVDNNTWEVPRMGWGGITAVADNEAGKARFTCEAHGLNNGEVVNNMYLSVAQYQSISGTISNATADTFDLENITFTTTAFGFFYVTANIYYSQKFPATQAFFFRNIIASAAPTPIKGNAKLVSAEMQITEGTKIRLLAPRYTNIDFYTDTANKLLYLSMTGNEQTKGTIGKVDYTVYP